MLVVVGDQVAQREAVMGGDEVDAGMGPAAAPVEQIAGPADPGRQLAELPLVAAPVGPHRVAEPVVPFRPARRKAAHLIAPRADVPGLGDQLDAGEHRILPAAVEEAAALVEAMRLAAEDGREIEAESVDPHFRGPVAQAVHHHLQDARIGEIEGIAGSGIVYVVARIVRPQPVVAGIVDALEGKRRPQLVALGGMVVDDVQDHLDAGVVEARHHFLELVHERARQVARIGREEAERVVAPVVRQPALDQRAIVDEGMDRHQLDGRHPEAGEMIDDGGVGDAADPSAQVGRHRRGADGQPLDVRFVDDGAFPRDRRRPVPSPGLGIRGALSRRSNDRSRRAEPMR